MERHLLFASAVLAAAIAVITAIPVTQVNDYKWETKYYENLIDHFSFDTDSRYKQKYLINWDSFKPGGPVFFYAGNEGIIENFAENTGFMWEIAPDYNAVLVFAEHRYYGESMPFGNESLTVRANRAYLSSEQALADFAELLHYLRHSDQRLADSPVIAFGGSYGGMLAAWFRMKYPHIIQGAIAASAPVVQFPGFTPCRVFNDIVQKVFQNATPNGQCDDRFGKAFQLLRAAQKDQLAKKILSTTWHLCTPLQTEKDIDDMINFLEDFFGNVAMVNYPYPANFIMDLPGNPITAMCEAMELPGKNIVDALAAGFKVAYNHTGKAECWNWTTSSAEKLGTDAWDFQACTEMVMPMCTRKGNLMFPSKEWDFEKFTKDCMEKWGVRPRPEMAMTNYGSNWLKAASNIVFSNGDLDPWSGGGVYLNLTSNSVWSLLIHGGAHHLDLRDSNPADPLTVTIARDFEKQRIHEWISTYKAGYA